ncbi:alpha/beta fold hydrolase [Conexibacter sp. SYSU D00693]|uniref:alpha/beta fold hydrolase n=1 Tax=Conexibacter sp. SYSU D00693 TaxID=2812560 RepID=UPI00196B3C77|nr:alpha/beta hydrolase [Conexibacter sp. SYSU D00693]
MTHTFGESRHVTLADGRRLHAMVRGAGDVTVVLDAGMGLSRSSWGLVVPDVAEQARTVVYDRAGLGRSDRDPRPRTLEHLRDDLLALLAELGDGPFVLVGHSWGGPVVRTAAAALGPGAVRGVVLVDQVDEHCDLYFEPSSRKRFTASARMVGPMARVGLYRLVGSRPGRHQPADVVADHRAEDFTPAAAAAMGAELDVFIDELEALRAAPPRLDGIPVSVITGTRPTRADRKVRSAIVAAHRRTAEVLPDARLVEAPGSAHLVPFTEPELVVREVLRLAG